MSKTDKTKPWRIRVMEHHPWADHDHRDGICDLPAHFKDNSYSGGSHCRWLDWNLCYKGNCCYGCGCHMCTDQAGRKAKRRRERSGAKRENRAQIKNWAGL